MNVTQMKVDFIDKLGTDLTVVNSARVSFSKESEFEQSDYGNIKKLSDADAKLVKYLARHNHWSPFAHAQVQLRVKAPIFVARQLVKHQVGGVWNEVSRRYVDDAVEVWMPKAWHGRPKNAKQGASNEEMTTMLSEDDAECSITEAVMSSIERAVTVYNTMIGNGVAPEEARIVLPLNMMTEWYWTGSLMFWARVCKQRLDNHAQGATREVGALIRDAVAPHYPVTWAALMEEVTDASA